MNTEQECAKLEAFASRSGVMNDLKRLIEHELENYLEWPTADKSHVTTVSAKLFAEHVARLYADHIHDDAPQPAEQQPDVTQLVEALDLALEYWRDRQQRYKNRRPKWVIAAESALAAHRQGGES